MPIVAQCKVGGRVGVCKDGVVVNKVLEQVVNGNETSHGGQVNALKMHLVVPLDEGLVQHTVLVVVASMVMVVAVTVMAYAVAARLILLWVVTIGVNAKVMMEEEHHLPVGMVTVRHDGM